MQVQPSAELPPFSTNGQPPPIDHLHKPNVEKATFAARGKISNIDSLTTILKFAASILTGDSCLLIRSINQLHEKIIEKDPVSHELHRLEREVKTLVKSEKKTVIQKKKSMPNENQIRLDALNVLKAKILKFNEANDIKFFEPENLSMDSASRRNRSRTENLLNEVNKELRKVGGKDNLKPDAENNPKVVSKPTANDNISNAPIETLVRYKKRTRESLFTTLENLFPGESLRRLPALPQSPLRKVNREIHELSLQNNYLLQTNKSKSEEFKLLEKKIIDLKKEKIVSLDSEIKALDIKFKALNKSDRRKAKATRRAVKNLQHERLNLLIEMKVAPGLESMSRTFEASTKALKTISQEPASQGAVISSQEAMDHLRKFDREMVKIRHKVRIVCNELGVLKAFMESVKDAFTYNSLERNQKNALTSAHQDCIDMTNAITDVVNDVGTGTFNAFQKKPPLVFPMEIVMKNPLLNCKIQVNSQEELDSLKKACFKSTGQLSSFREEMRGITRFSNAETFGNLP